MADSTRPRFRDPVFKLIMHFKGVAEIQVTGKDAEAAIQKGAAYLGAQLDGTGCVVNSIGGTVLKGEQIVQEF